MCFTLFGCNEDIVAFFFLGATAGVGLKLLYDKNPSLPGNAVATVKKYSDKVLALAKKVECKHVLTAAALVGGVVMINYVRKIDITTRILAASTVYKFSTNNSFGNDLAKLKALSDSM